MNSCYIINNARIINEGFIKQGSVFVEDGIISDIFFEPEISTDIIRNKEFMVIDAKGSYLMPGVIDDQVHFRDPGLTHKGDLFSESRAAVAGGVTSFMDMPNTNPQTITNSLLEDKFKLAAEKSLANYSFYLGATNNNIEEIRKVDPQNVCGIKVFMGASTGNMLVDDEKTLDAIFRESPILVAIHSEYEPLIKTNIEQYKSIYGKEIPMQFHPAIRSEQACFQSTERAVKLALKHNTRLHILHLSTAAETKLLDPSPLSNDKMITAEVCAHHLWFCDSDYEKLGTLIKWNPAIKTAADREGLLKALLDGRIDVVATDHAPHTLDEKLNNYFNAPSGGPLIQHSLSLMFELASQGKISPEKIVEKMCHNMAICFGIEKRGFIRKGYHADITIVNPELPYKIEKSNILYKCGWSPFEGITLQARITHTFVNGKLVFEEGKFDESIKGNALCFNR